MEPLGRMTLTFRIFRTIYNITQSYLTEGEGTVNAKLIKLRGCVLCIKMIRRKSVSCLPSSIFIWVAKVHSITTGLHIFLL